jgi:NAD(P)-dependent dehydrogenase (short-subunit alcohol dehydrogenase family)
VENLTLDDWQRSLAVNITAPFLLVKHLLPCMERGSAIVNISSTAAFKGYPDWSSYSVAKFGLEGFSQSIREELRPRGIRVLNVNPGATNTDIWKSAPGDWPRDKMLDPAQVAEAVAFMLERPDNVATESIILRSIAGEL